MYPLVHFAVVGGAATFTCNATGVPSQNITWTTQGQTEKNINDARHSMTSFGSGSSQLTIKNVAIDDHGYYVCDATVNINQPNSATGYLQVLCKFGPIILLVQAFRCNSDTTHMFAAKRDSVFFNHEYHYIQNWTTRSPFTN